MLADAHALGLRVTIDIVPNHTSSAHAWFQAALRSSPGSVERSRYVFRRGKGRGGVRPPNNWPSAFGGPARTRAGRRVVRAALARRRELLVDRGEPLEWVASTPGTLVFRRGPLTCLMNFLSVPRRFAMFGEVVMSSSSRSTGGFCQTPRGIEIVANTTVWLIEPSA